MSVMNDVPVVLGINRTQDASACPVHTQRHCFSAGTTDWAQVLDAGRDRQLERVTRNVLDGLLRR